MKNKNDRDLSREDGIGATKVNTKEGGFKLRMRIKTFLWLMMLAFTSGAVSGMYSLIRLTPVTTASEESLESRHYEEPRPEEGELPHAVPVHSARHAATQTGQSTGATSLSEDDFQKLEQELAAVSAKKSGVQETKYDIMSMVYGLVDSAKKALSELAAKGTPPDSVSSDFDITSDCCVSESVLNKVFRGVLKGKGGVFAEAGKKHGINPLFLAGVALHESDNGGSRIAKECHNVLGVMTDSGPKRFDSVEDCVEYMASRLKTAKCYVRGGKNTVAEIQKSYCPVGAKNDPTKLNKYWLKGVVASMNKILDAGKVASK